MSISVYGVEFKNVSAFCRALGYSHAFSKTLINKQYGSLENMAKTRLNLPYDYQLREKLLELRDGSLQSKQGNVTIEPAAFSVLKAIYKQTDPAVVSAITAATASILNIDLNELEQRIKIVMSK